MYLNVSTRSFEKLCAYGGKCLFVCTCMYTRIYKLVYMHAFSEFNNSMNVLVAIPQDPCAFEQSHSHFRSKHASPLELYQAHPSREVNLALRTILHFGE